MAKKVRTLKFLFYITILFVELPAEETGTLKQIEITGDEIQGCWVTKQVLDNGKEIQDRYSQTLIFFPAQKKAVVIATGVQQIFSPLAKDDIIGLHSSAWTVDYDMKRGEDGKTRVDVSDKLFIVNGYGMEDGKCIMLELVLEGGKNGKEWVVQYRRPRNYFDHDSE